MHNYAKGLLILIVKGILACGQECPKPTPGAYVGAATITQAGCTLDVGDVAPYDAIVADMPTVAGPSCSAHIDQTIDRWRYEGTVFYLAPTMWAFEGTVYGRHCAIPMRILAARVADGT